MASEFHLIDECTSSGVATATELQRRFGGIADLAAASPKPMVVVVALADRFALLGFLAVASQLEIVVVPLAADSTSAQFAAFIDEAQPTLIVTDLGETIGWPVQARVLGPDDLATDTPASTAIDIDQVRCEMHFFTSGSTGSPKCVVLQPAQLTANTQLALRHLPYRRGGTTGSLLPGHHTFTLISDLLTAIAVQGGCVVLPLFSFGSFNRIVNALKRREVMSFSAVPVILDAMCRLGQSLRNSSLEFVVSGAAPLSAELVERYEETFDHAICPCYGLTEAVCFVAISEPGTAVAGKAGKPVIPLRITIDDESAVPPGQSGEIQIRGATVIAAGYRAGAAANADLYTADGWLRTGDVGTLDADGVLSIRGRTKNMIIRGGEKLYLEDIENLFATGAAAGVPLAKGEAVEGYVLVLEHTAQCVPQLASEADVRLRIAAHMGERWLPDRIVRVDTIPKTPTGKIIRSELAGRASL